MSRNERIYEWSSNVLTVAATERCNLVKPTMLSAAGADGNILLLMFGPNIVRPNFDLDDGPGFKFQGITKVTTAMR